MIIPANFAQVNLLFGGVGQPNGAQVTFGVDLLLGALDPTGVGNSVVNAYNVANFDNLMNSSVTLTGVLVKFGPNATGPAVQLSVATVGMNSDPASPGVAYLTHKNTGLGGRKGRGRAYWPGVRESVVDAAGLVAAATITAWNVALDDFMQSIAADGLNVVLLHSDATAPTDVTTWTFDSKVASQRRRQRR